MRRRCVRDGHRWDGMLLPFQYCVRWRCEAERVNPDFPFDPETRRRFELWLARRARDG